MLNVRLYTKENCPTCEEAYGILKMLQSYYSFEIEKCDIYTKDEWLEEYQLIIPVVQIKDVFLNSVQIDIVTIEQELEKNNKL